MVSVIDREDNSESKKFAELYLVPGYSLEGGIEPASESSEVVTQMVAGG